MSTVSLYGQGQLGTAVAKLLRGRADLQVSGPYGRDARDVALGSGSDVVIIATTTRLADVIDDIRAAVDRGSNVIVSAEEAACPYATDDAAAQSVGALARERGVTVLGAGVNPGLLFDALVLTYLGAAPAGCTIHVRRVVDISGFGTAVLRRIGVGLSAEAFAIGVADGSILGHAGFPQSMALVAAALGMQIQSIDRNLQPIFALGDIRTRLGLSIEAGETAGVRQRYSAQVDGQDWFTAEFLGHVDLSSIDREPRDDIELSVDGVRYQQSTIRPGISAQAGSANMIANSVDRVRVARPGWLTVADIQPAFPRLHRDASPPFAYPNSSLG